MKKRILWLTLHLVHVLASNIRNPVRLRQASSAYYNTSKSITTIRITSTAIGASTEETTRGGGGIDSTSTDIESKYSGKDEPKTGRDGRPGTPPVTSGRTPGCIDTVVTYTKPPPATVYMTVDGYYNITVTANNTSVTAPILYETPPQACSTLFLSKYVSKSFGPPPPHGTPVMLSTVTGVPPEFTGLLPDARETTTILVTKKTPVPVVEPTEPPVTFKDPRTTNHQSPIGVVTTVPDGAGGSPNKNPSNSPSDPSTQSVNNLVPPDPGSELSALQSFGNAVASVINSVVNSPSLGPTVPAPNQANPTKGFPAAPATPTINGVPVTIGPSNVQIGSQNVVIPTSSQTVIVVDSQTFTVKQSEIIGTGTTYQIQSQLVSGPTITQAPSVVTTAGVTLTIGQTIAIISGTTYRIGNGAVQTSIVINSQTIGIGSDGITILGATPTTFAPPMTIANGYEIVVVDGLTVSVDQTVAVISGATFRIGSGATLTTVTIGGKTITIGPSGVVLPNTTIKPTSVPNVTASTTRSASTAQITSSTTQNGGSSSQYALIPDVLLRLVAILTPALWLV